MIYFFGLDTESVAVVVIVVVVVAVLETAQFRFLCSRDVPVSSSFQNNFQQYFFFKL